MSIVKQYEKYNITYLPLSIKNIEHTQLLDGYCQTI